MYLTTINKGNSQVVLYKNLSLKSSFNTNIASISNCEIWDMHAANNIEKVHLEYIKFVLSLKKNTNTAIVYVETGRLYL